MSTKTTFKRIALVAVAALGLSVVAVAPSSAAQTVANAFINCTTADGGTITPSATTGAECGGVAGASNFVTLTGFQTAKDVELTVTGGNFVAQTSGNTFITNGTNTVALAAAANANTTIKVATPVAGTITVSVKTATAGSGLFTASTETVVITVGATALAGTYSAAKSGFYLVSGETFTATADATTAPTKAKTYTATDSATASIVAYYKDGLDVAITSDTLTATITSGPGTILTASVAAGTYDSATAYTKQSQDSIAKYTASTRPDSTGRAAFFLYANGLAGTSVVTIKNTAGTVVATKSVVFTDTTIASITATVLKPTVQGDTAAHTGGVIKLTLKDSAGNAITSPSAYPTATVSPTTLAGASISGANDTATANAAGEVFWGVDSLAAETYGKFTVTFKAGTVTASADVTLSSAKASTFTITGASTSAGLDVVHTVTAKDANGYAVPEGSALTDYVSARTTTGGIATDLDITTANKSVAGVWTVKGVAPLATTELATTYTLTGTAGKADTKFVATLAGTKPVVTVAVNNPATDGAIDAANEATDAANAATDAALAAADAADAATAAAEDASAAVATLAKSVNTALANLKKQITALTALVNKLLKK
ncbi:beta strand repeat-containing protein [Candidatus Planktophila versatilis]|uniref:beta strand repeat-containing protein n=1 Tax=Candidatus Planktophila versatilis TaxID=1884905 RepID=UPI000BAC7042|nr:hypothetical protein [Candidatus Planktophila versatilis]ASY25886.1 hypothetical protein A1sIIB142_00260 [Candidatus Planktophila versatilis]